MGRKPHFRLIFGRSDRIRTCGILLPKQARYQLRYTPKNINRLCLSIFCLLCSPSSVAWSPRVARGLAPVALRLAPYHGVKTPHRGVFTCSPKAGALPTALHPEKYKWSLSEHSRSALFALAGRVVAACYSQARSRGSPLGGVSLRENTAPWCFHLLTQSRRATNCATPRLCLPCIISCFIIIAKAR